MSMEIELEHRGPIDFAELVRFFDRRAVAGVEEVVDGVYRRSLRLADGPATIEVFERDRRIVVAARTSSDSDGDAAVVAARRLFDLDADPEAIAGALSGDSLIGGLIEATPGRRLPGHVDPAELVARAIVGQQISLTGAATVTSRLVAEHGEHLPEPLGSVTHLFPSSAKLASLAAEDLPMPRSRGRALIGAAAALADRSLVLDRCDIESTRAALLVLPGIGPWTTSYVEMRALGNGDAFLATDLGVRRSLERLGEDGSPAAAAAIAERWRPYRAYALQHLWSTLDDE